jgi:glycosyltransferase involved in cell wall biosynthesis
MKKRILFIIDHLGTGGSQEFILNYSKHIPEHQITVLSLFGDDIYSPRLKAQGVEVVFLCKEDYRFLNILKIKTYFRFKQFISKRSVEFDGIIIRLFASFLYSSLLKLYRSESVFASIDANHKQLPFAIQVMYGVFARCYKHFFLIRFCEKEFKFLGIKPEHLLENRLFVTECNSEKPFQFPHTFNILSIGRCIQQKGFLEAIQLFNILQPLTPVDIGLYIIGDGEYKNYLQEYIRENHITDVYFLGTIINLEDYYKSAQLLLKLAFYEGVNSVVREAMLSKLPVAATVESAWCEELIQKKLFLQIYRDDLFRSANVIKTFIANPTTIDIHATYDYASSQWSGAKVGEYYRGIINGIHSNRTKRNQ